MINCTRACVYMYIRARVPGCACTRKCARVNVHMCTCMCVSRANSLSLHEEAPEEHDGERERRREHQRCLVVLGQTRDHVACWDETFGGLRKARQATERLTRTEMDIAYAVHTYIHTDTHAQTIFITERQTVT